MALVTWETQVYCNKWKVNIHIVDTHSLLQYSEDSVLTISEDLDKSCCIWAQECLLALVA